MSLPIVTTRLAIPPTRADLIPRSQLLERLQTGLMGKLTVVSAPAGFGKTTLVSSWVRQLDRPAVWLALDEHDNDLTRFLLSLTTALQTIDDQIGQTGLDMLHLPQPPPTEFLLTALVNDVTATAPHFLCVLDDYHTITAPSIHTALNFILTHLPPPMHLVLISRADPPLALSRLRAQAQVHEVREADLRFNPDEVEVFLNRCMGLTLTPDDVQALAQRTEGWVAGLHLAGLSLQGLSARDQHQFVTAFAGTDRYIMEYLLEEVLHRQPPAIQTFLLHTALVDRLCAALCDALMQHDAVAGEYDETASPSSLPTSQTMLERLERANLFLVPLDHRREWYRYHHLFAELLRFHLHATYPDRVAPLHLRASAWYAANGFATEAVYHAFAAGSFEQAADLLEHMAQFVLSHGKLFTIQAWFHSLPEDLVQSRLNLAVYQVWTLVATGHIVDAEARLHALEDAVGQDTDSHLAGALDALRAFFAYNHGDFPRSITYAQNACTRLAHSDSFFYLFSTSLLGNAYRLNGDTAAAITVCRALSQHKRAGQRVASAIMGLGNLVRLYLIQGSLHQAAHTYQQAFQDPHVPLDTSTPLAGVACIGMGEVLCEWNNLDAAASHLHHGVTICQRWPALVEFLVDGVAGLVRVLHAQHKRDEAFRLIHEMEQWTEASALMHWKRPRLAACRARLWLAPPACNLAAARQWAETSGLTPHDDPLPVSEFEYLTLARVCIAESKYDDALMLLSNLERAATAAGRMRSVLECLIMQAVTHQLHGQTDEARTTIARALALAEPEGYIRLFVDEGEPIAMLLRQEAMHGETRAYAAMLVATCDAEAHGSSSAEDSTGPLDPGSAALAEPLSQREREVLRLLNTHLSGPEIAATLTISVNTVKTHRKRIYSKLNVSNRREAVARAKELNLL